MLNVQLDETDGLAILEPQGELTKSDFETAAEIVDPYITKFGKLSGIIIRVRSFPGWDSFSALVTHFRFVKEHHEMVERVAFVTDSPIGEFAEHVAKHFVRAQIKSFSFDTMDEARSWIAHAGSENPG